MLAPIETPSALCLDWTCPVILDLLLSDPNPDLYVSWLKAMHLS